VARELGGVTGLARLVAIQREFESRKPGTWPGFSLGAATVAQGPIFPNSHDLSPAIGLTFISVIAILWA